MIENPYTAGHPIRESTNFFGRGNLLKRMTSKLDRKKSLVLHGQRRIGKTSLLHQFAEILKKRNYLPVYYSAESIYLQPLGTALAELADRIQLTANRLYNVGLKDLEADLFDNEGRYFQRHFLSQVYHVIKEGNEIVILIDEFDGLCDHYQDDIPLISSGRSFAPFLKRLLESERKIRFVFSVGLREDVLSRDIKRILESSARESIWVLEEREARDLILQAENNRTLNFEKPVVDQILLMTHGHPYLIQMLCDVIWERAYSSESISKTVTMDDLNIASRLALNEYKYGLSSIWDGLEPAERLISSALCHAPQEDSCNAYNSEQAMLLLSKEDISLDIASRLDGALSSLVNKNFLRRVNHNIYSYHYPLFQSWVQQQLLSDIVVEAASHDTEIDKKILQGENFVNRKQWREAIRVLTGVLSERRRNCPALTYRGQAFRQLGNLPKALGDLRRAYKLKPWIAERELAKTLSAYAEEMILTDEKEALILAEEALSVLPTETKAAEIKKRIWTSRGDSAVANNNYSVAIKAYRAAGDEQKVIEAHANLRRQVTKCRRAIDERNTVLSKSSRDITKTIARIAESSERIALLRGIRPSTRGVWWAASDVFRQEEYLTHLLSQTFQALGSNNYYFVLHGIEDQRIIRPLSLYRDSTRDDSTSDAISSTNSGSTERIYQAATESVLSLAWNLFKLASALKESTGSVVSMLNDLKSSSEVLEVEEEMCQPDAELAWQKTFIQTSSKEKSFRLYWDAFRFIRNNDFKNAESVFGWSTGPQ